MAMTKSEVAAHCRRLIRGTRSASLSTNLALKIDGKGGWPYGSFVTVATDADLSPVLLFSDLSDHCRNLKTDDRASLLFEQASNNRNPQTGPRVTVIGRITRSRSPRHKARFLARHPEAEMYAGFGDFHFHRMSVERVHYVGGFARAQWLAAKDVMIPARGASAMAKSEADILAHMNADHADAVDLYANKLLGRKGRGWTMTGVDPDGADLMKDGRSARLDFASPVDGPEACRETLVALVKKARGKG